MITKNSKNSASGESINLKTLIFALAIVTITGCSHYPVTSELDKGLRLAQQIKQFLGAPYHYGGNNPQGFGCSGLMQYTHKKLGIKIPRTAAAQLKYSNRIKLANIKPGDLIFFRSNRHKVSHVGMYTGKMQMIHAPSNRKHVSYANLNNDYWRSRITAVGRYY